MAPSVIRLSGTFARNDLNGDLLPRADEIPLDRLAHSTLDVLDERRPESTPTRLAVIELSDAHRMTRQRRQRLSRVSSLVAEFIAALRTERHERGREIAVSVVCNNVAVFKALDFELSHAAPDQMVCWWRVEQWNRLDAWAARQAKADVGIVVCNDNVSDAVHMERAIRTFVTNNGLVVAPARGSCCELSPNQLTVKDV